MAVCSESHTKQINTVCGQNVELLNVKLVVYIVTTGLQMVNANNIQIPVSTCQQTLRDHDKVYESMLHGEIIAVCCENIRKACKRFSKCVSILKRLVQMVTIFKGHILSVLAWKTEKETLYVERNELPQ